MILTVCCEHIAPLCLLYLPLLATAGALEQPLLIAEADGLHVCVYSYSTNSCALRRLSWLQCRRHDLNQDKLSCVSEAPIHLLGSPRRHSSIARYLNISHISTTIKLLILKEASYTLVEILFQNNFLLFAK